MAIKLTVTFPDQHVQSFTLSSSDIKIGCLSSNEIFLEDKSLKPIHALLSLKEDGLRLENISESKDIFLKGELVTSSSLLSVNDQMKIGSFTIVLDSLEASDSSRQGSQDSSSSSSSTTGVERRRSPSLLFKPRKGEITGDVLEVVSYWDDRILDLEHFEGTIGNATKNIYIGSSPEAHFKTSNARPGESLFKFCELGSDTFTLFLTKAMTARVRKSGVYIDLGPGSHTLKKNDVAHVKYHSMRFFLIHKKLPKVKLPKEALEDPLFAGLLAFFLVSFFAFCSSLFLLDPPSHNKDEEKLWAVVKVDSKHNKNKADFDAVRTPVEFEKVVAKKEAPIEISTEKEPAKAAPKHDRFQKMEQLNRALDRKVSGSKVNKVDKSKGGLRKGRDKTDKSGVEDGKSSQSSGMNLSLVGLGLGKVSSSGGLGAISVDALNASGGAGRGEGSSAKTFGLGGVGSDLSDMSLSSLNSGAMNFGKAKGSIGGTDMNSNFKRKSGAAKVNVQTGDPLIGPGIDKEGVWSVLLSASRAINHCYNTLLQRSPKAAGTVTLGVVIGLDGRGAASKVTHSEIKDKSMQSCMVKVIKRLKFPKPQGGREVEFKMPYGFSPE